MSLGDRFLEELKATKRPIHRMSILQKACNTLPPGELTKLYLQLPKIGGRELCKSAPYYKYMVAGRRRRAAKGAQLVKHPDEEHYAFFESKGTSPVDKTLYILFGGNHAQFLIPLSVVLYLLPKGAKDVAVIFSKVRKMYYANGVEDMGRNAYEVAAHLKERLKVESYQRLVVMGTSSGGVFAQRVAGFLNADITLSFGAAYAKDGFLMADEANRSASAFDPLCACRPHRGGRMVNLFAAQNDGDIVSSRMMKAVRPNLIEVLLVHQKKHNVLQVMVQRNTAGLYFRTALAKNDAAIRLISKVTKAYGVNVARRFLRRLER